MPDQNTTSQLDSQEDTASDTDEADNKLFLDNRHLFRQIVIQKLYEHNFVTKKTDLKFANHDTDLDTDLELEYVSSKLARKLRRSLKELDDKVAEVRAVEDRIDEVIKVLAPAWPIDQINPVDLQILRLGIFEGFISGEVPEKVAIDEAIELSRDFGTESNVKFVSGVLGNLIANDELKNKLKQEK